MPASHSEIMIRQLSPGELQRLAADLLPRLYNDWGPVIQSGTVEGTLKTRKGTPDAWCERVDESYVYIQATGDMGKGKVLEDLTKSIKKLVTIDANEGALCVAFINFDAQPEEINECKMLAQKHKTQFVYYNNSSIAMLLDSEDHQDLRYKYLKIPSETKNKIKPELKFALSKSKGAEPKSLTNMNNVLQWNLDKEELKGTLESVVDFYHLLKKLNEPSRRFFASIMELGEQMTGFLNDHKMNVPYQEIKNALGLENWEINAQMDILSKYKLGYIEDGEWPAQLIIQASDWPLLSDIKNYCEEEEIDFMEIIVNLQFSLLD
jgi:hypothetical protein